MQNSGETSLKAPNYPIASVDAALRLVLLFREQREIRLFEAAEELGVARSTAHRLLAMLQYHGLVRQEEGTRGYVAGPALVDVGLQVVRDHDIRNNARPFLQELCEETGETVHLAILQGASIVFLDSIETNRSVRVGSRTGIVLPAHVTAAGKAMLADLSADRLRELYPHARLSGGTDLAVRTRRELQEQLDEVRDVGYAVNVGQSESDVAAIGAAVKDRAGRVRAAVSVAAPAYRLTSADVPAVAKAVVSTAADIGTALS